LVLPIFEDKCFSCHNTDKAKGRLVLTDTDAILKGGKNGPLLLAGNPEKSLLMERLLLEIEHKHHMPPKDKPQLNPQEISLIKAWIGAGADFTLPLAKLPPGDTIRLLAEALYGSPKEEEETFAFDPPNPALVNQLNNAYRVIAPLAVGSPALDVSFFNSSFFKKESLQELKPISQQVVYLNLSGMPIADADLPLLEDFSNLRQLNLNYTAVSDKGLASLKNLPHLQSLMLTGTGVTPAGIDSLLGLPELRHLYVWNTPVTQQEAARWKKQRPDLVVETGFYDDGSLVLPLNKPKMQPERAFFREEFQLQLSHPISGTELRYTLDGSEPDSLSSPLFTKPIPLRENTLVKVKAFKKGWSGSPTVELLFHTARFQPDSAQLLLPPDPGFKARGAHSLFDLDNGSMDNRDGKWLGYRGTPLTAELEFKNPVALTEVALSALTNTRGHMFPPAAIQVWGGSGPQDMELLGTATPEMPGEHQAPGKHIYACPLKKREVTHMKILVQPVEKLPSWHQEKGQPGWVFADEILLN
ncbi:MAG TPA: c-type cytochrome domain-containing protein, partial [Anseongella sp.]|nr:c-type cytochrome domain-containing protein [Anseongella sp.]